MSITIALFCVIISLISVFIGSAVYNYKMRKKVENELLDKIFRQFKECKDIINQTIK